ncbi:uncharacterized protein LOC131041899 [Cryptomeria japonica]|uniref:uncharacterized protein LOC131041899 n=1 Tax=Cryptomeria japonica TaxID=3369 RepID=UPI0027DA33DC|nr:uncharacterized protein LOC131041899 [Cryptomeria japonica]
MSCVTSSSFLVIVNGKPSEPFGVSRGLHQGDPLLSYLFIIMVEGLGHFLKFRASQGLIHGWQWGNGLPQISHLQFVDDTTLMGLARIREAESFRYTLDIYIAASGQKVNEHKFSIFFFNTPQTIQRRIADILQFQVGLFALFIWVFLLLLEDTPGLLGRLYLTSCIRRCFVQVAPMYFLKEFDTLSRQFLWSGTLSTAKWSLVKWDTMCRPKNEGGLGLCSAILNGQALAAKLYCHWCTSKNQLWVRILTHKYLPNVNVFDVSCFPVEGRGSMICNTLKLGAQLVKNGLFWICHTGSQDPFWLDSWDGHPPILSTHPHLQSLSDMFISVGWDTIDHYKIAHNGGLVACFRWKNPSELPLGGFVEDRKELAQILESRECTTLVRNDALVCASNNLSGKFYVSTGCVELVWQTFGDIQVPWWKQVWYKFSWPKYNFFMWLVVHNRCLN